MKLFVLGELNWRQSQLIYHTLAHLNIEGLVLHSTKEPYMCVGLHQNPRDEINLEYCKKNNIGVFRREIGGGTVLLDKNQVFYHLILHRNHPLVPYAPESFFRKFLKPVIQTYNELGIPVTYQPLCDLVVHGKKISGNGGGEVGDCKVLGGGILLDFDYERMAKATESTTRLQQRFLGLMQVNLTTVRKELKAIPSKDEICSLLVNKYSDLFGPMTEGSINDEIKKKMEALEKHYFSEEWLYQKGMKQNGKEIKVREGVFLFYQRTSSSEISEGITCEIEDNKIKKVFFPSSFQSKTAQKAVQDGVLGKEYDRRNLSNTIREVVKNHGGVIVA